MKLVKSNSEEAVKATTTAAFSLDLSAPEIALVEKAMNELIKLKGIGPASASLLLSVYNPDGLPFFSDELYHFVNETGSFSATKANRTAKIAYSKKEYKELYGKVQQLRDRIQNDEGESVSALDLEMTAYVLARSNQLDIAVPEEASQEPKEIAPAADETEEPDVPEPRASKRRKTGR